MNFCCQTLLVEDLQKQAKGMEEELERWNKELTLARKKFYELNYYTTRQLLVLRSELGRLKTGLQQSSCGQVMALLESISSAINPRALAKVVQEVANRSVEDTEDVSLVPTIAPTQSQEVESLLVSMPPTPTVASQFASEAEPIDVAEALPSLPAVGLTEEDLNDKQKAHFTDILNKYGFCEKTALKAIEAVPDGDWNDIVNCLEENAGEWETVFLKSQEAEGEEGVEEEPEYSEDEEMESSSETEDAPQPMITENTSSRCIYNI